MTHDRPSDPATPRRAVPAAPAPGAANRPSRRSFLAGLGALVGIGAVEACAAPATTYVERAVTPTPTSRLVAQLPAGFAPVASPQAATVGLTAAPSPIPSPGPPPLPTAERGPAIRFFAGAVGPLHGPAFVARALTLWGDRYGLNVDLKFGDPQATLLAVQGGHFEAALMPVASVILFADKGQALTIVAGTAYGGHSLVVTPGVDGGPRLRGKSYGAPARWDYLDVFFRRHVLTGPVGLSADEMTLALLPVDAAPDALKRGDVAAYLLPEPFATRAVEGGARRLLDWREVADDGQYHLECLVFNRQFLKGRPVSARRLVWAHLDGLRYLSERPQSALQVLSQTPGNTATARTYAAALERVGLDQPRIPTPALRTIIDDYRQSRLLSRALTPDDLTDYSLQDDYTPRPF